MNINELKDQWFDVASNMETVAHTFRVDKTPTDTAKALNDLGDSLKELATKIREQYT